MSSTSSVTDIAETFMPILPGCTPPRTAPHQLVTMFTSVFRVSSRNWADLLVVPKRTRAQFLDEFQLTAGSLERLDAAIARGKGCVLVTAHLGAFDYMGHFLHALGYKLSIVTGRTTARMVFDGVTSLRQSNGLGSGRSTPSGVRKAIHAVMLGNCAVIVSDRDFFQNGVDVEFFGVRTTLPPGAVRIAETLARRSCRYSGDGYPAVTKSRSSSHLP